MVKLKKLVIRGGVPLRGEVRISGSKNAALPCLFATLLTDEDCRVENVPDLDDIDTACSLLEHLGKKVTRRGRRVDVVQDSSLRTDAPYELVRRMRASVLVLGPLLARMGRASASLPGGCAIGNRPVDIHISGLERLGAGSDLSQGMVRLKIPGAARGRRLTGKTIDLNFPSVGATENLLMAAAIARGTTVIRNAAKEPEIVDLALFLSEMGADISGAGSSAITIRGRKTLHGARHEVIPDRIETATYLLAAAATRGSLTLRGTRSEHLECVIKNLRKTGAEVRTSAAGGEESILCASGGNIRPVDVTTGVYPEFPTDVQAQWMALMSLARGRTVIRESIFENRFLHAAELSRMGADIRIRGARAVVLGVKGLSGANVMVSDLRAGAAMVIAGLAARGRTVVHRIYHLDRGYEKLESKLRKTGARIRRV